MLEQHIILGVHITDRAHHAAKVQEVLTEYGCAIKTRIGLHDVGEKHCSPTGLLLLEFIGSETDSEALRGRLAAVAGVEVKKMIFDHP